MAHLARLVIPVARGVAVVGLLLLPPAMATVPKLPSTANTYNGSSLSVAPTHLHAERGPLDKKSLAARSRSEAHDAQGPRSAVARSLITATPVSSAESPYVTALSAANQSAANRSPEQAFNGDLLSILRLQVAANGGTRLAQDIAVSPVAPRALSLNRSIGRTSHNRMLQADIAALPRGATGVRVNQQQVNAAGQRVGINRPDLQYTLNGKRYYVEYEGPANPRGAAHQARILANDPGAQFLLRIVP